jgi:hypothetical protein
VSNQIELPEALHLARYRISLSPEAPLALPAYKGAVLRGSLGAMLKRAVCVRPSGRLCQRCELPDLCPYAYLFEGHPRSDREVLRGANRIPPPYTLEPPLDWRQELEASELLTFHLLLFGNAIRYFPYLLAAFRELERCGLGERRIPCRLVDARALPPSGEKVPLYDAAAGRLLGNQPSPPSARDWLVGMPSATPTLTLHFLTLTRLKYKGRFLEEAPPFHVVVRTLLRRVSSLSYFYGGQRWETDYRGWIEKAKQVEMTEAHVSWVDWERYSTRQQQRMNLGGLVGQVTYRGDASTGLSTGLTPFLPLLRLGELVHVGKGAVFGNGQYRMEMGD